MNFLRADASLKVAPRAFSPAAFPAMLDHRRTSRLVTRLLCVALACGLAACATRIIAPVEDRRTPPTRALPPTLPAPPVATPSTAPSTQPPSAPAIARAPATPATPAEPDWRPSSYTVKRGDTLHVIALEHGLDYRDLAAWNAIENPNLIRTGQVLRLAPPGDAPAVAAGDTQGGVTTAPLRSAAPVVESRATPAAPVPPTAVAPPPPTAVAPPPSAPRGTETLKVAPKAVKERYSAELAREMARVPPEPAREIARASPEPAPIARADPPKPAPPPTPSPAVATPPPSPPPVVATVPPSAPRASAEPDGDIEWTWPAKGKLVTGFSDTANLKGIDIAGSSGQPVLASAPGRVVYAGSGLRGYGKLVIIKHNNTFLSAYAHNRDIVVKEGQQVKRGEKIAEMGSSDAEQVKLHFEIRRLGKPMDPLKYLPPG